MFPWYFEILMHVFMFMEFVSVCVCVIGLKELELMPASNNLTLELAIFGLPVCYPNTSLPSCHVWFLQACLNIISVWIQPWQKQQLCVGFNCNPYHIHRRYTNEAKENKLEVWICDTSDKRAVNLWVCNTDDWRKRWTWHILELSHTMHRCLKRCQSLQ